MNILVLGGSGFLGSHVADKLTFAKHNVRIFDRFPSPWLLPGQKMITGDLLDQTALEEAIKGCEAVYNFAAVADLDEALDKPMETARVNVMGNVQILEACRKAGVQRYVYASTIYVYSREGGFYRCSKQAAEQYVEEYQSRYGLDYTILRYGSLYGTRTDNRNGVWRIIERALKTGQVSYEGNSEAMREYIHVEDAALASVNILDGEFCNKHIVLTGFQQMRVLDLLKMLAEILNLPEDSVNFIPTEKLTHYVRTPYAYQPKLGRKYTPPLHIDLGQGLLQMIEEIKAKKS
tara:strand:- start:1048 stop:1920 length:873 start_codon:yes stop_codon:yes gene_type:complete